MGAFKSCPNGDKQPHLVALLNKEILAKFIMDNIISSCTNKSPILQD